MPDIDLGFYEIRWTEWWLVLLGVSFVCVTLFAPSGLGGLVDLWTNRRRAGRQGDYGPDEGAKRNVEGAE